MSGQAGLKAGLIGGAIVLLFTALSQVPVPFFCCGCTALTLLAYIGIGVLAGVFLNPPRDAGKGAGAGAIAGVISGLVAGIVLIVGLGIQMAFMGTGDILSTVDPQTLKQLEEIGLSAEAFAALSGVTGVGIVGGMCCLADLAIGAGLGAAGGAIFGAAKPD